MIGAVYLCNACDYREADPASTAGYCTPCESAANPTDREPDDDYDPTDDYDPDPDPLGLMADIESNRYEQHMWNMSP